MAIINTKTSIPSIGDMVDKVLTSTDKRFAQITFQSGKKIVLSIDPSEFNVVPGKKPVIKDEQPPKQLLKKKVVTGSKVNEMTRNTPEDGEYKMKAMATLAKMQGSTPAEIEEMLNSQRSQPQILSETNTIPDDDFKAKAQAALEKSQQRATQLAESISSKHGGKLEKSFGGKTTIPLG